MGVEAEIREAERRRCDAMLGNDNAALDAVLDADLQFCHATGAVDDKAGYLAKMAAGRIKYVGVSWSEETVTPLADGAAILSGRMTTDVEVEGTAKRLENRAITVWRKSAGTWRLVAFQSTPIKA